MSNKQKVRVKCRVKYTFEKKKKKKRTQNTHFVWMDGEVFKAKQAYVGENGEGIVRIREAHLEQGQVSMMEIRHLRGFRSHNSNGKQFMPLKYTEYFTVQIKFWNSFSKDYWSILIRLPMMDPSNLKISKLFFNLFNVFIFRVVNVKVAAFGYSGPKTS